MKLREVIEDRLAINILKFAYDREVVEKSSYYTSISDINHKFGISKNILQSIDLLENAGLVNRDDVNESIFICITDKGKLFINLFDQLIVLIASHKDDKLKPANRFRIEYELTPLEVKLLVICYKMQNEAGSHPVSLAALSREIYPYENINPKRSAISRCVSRLAKLNLIAKNRLGRDVLILVTPSGIRAINSQYSNESFDIKAMPL